MQLSTTARRRTMLFGAALAISLIAPMIAAGRGAAQPEKPAEDDRILFVSDHEKKDQLAICTMKPDGSAQTRVSKGDGILFDPAWSPDHKQIAYTRAADGEARTSSVCIMKADGSGQTVLVPEEQQTFSFAPVWSPDGKHIAYCTVKIGDPPTGTVYIMDPDGKNRKKIVDGIVPVWSPDGKRLFFSSLPAAGPPDLKSMDLDGTHEKTFEVKGIGPAWSPDGKRIAFAGDSDGSPTLFTMDADGSNIRKVRQVADAICIGPVWTPDGKSLLYTQVPRDAVDKPQLTIWRTSLAGTDAHVVTKPNAFLGPATSILFIMRASGRK